MKNLIKSIPRKLFKLKNKKSRSVSRSNNPSFGSATSTDSSQKEKSGLATPTSVLSSHGINIHWDTIEYNNTNKTHDFVHAFKLMDRDGDGKITREELETLLRSGTEPLSEEEIKVMLSEIDSDGDGCISLEEFSLIGSAFEPPACDDEVRDTFDFFDADHNGKISADELYNVFRTIVGEERCTLEDCRRMIAGVDKNGDGFVCFDEFSLMMDQQLQGIF